MRSDDTGASRTEHTSFRNTKYRLSVEKKFSAPTVSRMQRAARIQYKRRLEDGLVPRRDTPVVRVLSEVLSLKFAIWTDAFATPPCLLDPVPPLLFFVSTNA